MQKRLVYKNAQFHGLSSVSLKKLLDSAVNRFKYAYTRQNKEENNKTIRLINYTSTFRGCRVGELIQYTKGEVQPFANTSDHKSAQLPVKSYKPPQDSEFLEGILYFQVSGNHLVVAQSSSLRTLQLESYLNWILRKADLLVEEQFLKLVDPTASLKLKSEPLRKVHIDTPVAFKAKNAEETTTAPTIEEEAKSVSFSIEGISRKILETIIPSRELSNLNVEDLIMGKELTMKMELYWKRAARDESSKLLDMLGDKLRHNDEIECTIETMSGATIRGDALKLRNLVSVGGDAFGLPKKDEMWDKMNDWLMELIQKHQIGVD